jgi:hypothetical protein
MVDRPCPIWTVAMLSERGVDAVDASCWQCGESWHAPISFLPTATTLGQIAALMACPTCGCRNVEVDATRRMTEKPVH